MMVERVINAVNRICKANKGACILIISHSGPIAVILASFYGKDLQAMLDDKVDNEEVIGLEMDNIFTRYL